MYQLVAQEPVELLDKDFSFIGYLGDKYAGPYITIFLTKDDAKLDNIPNSILMLHPTYKNYSEFCKNRYVEVKGQLKRNSAFYYLEIYGYMQPFDRETFKKLPKTCEPTNNQVQ